jgi:SNF2 family DNA or RNA helicase
MVLLRKILDCEFVVYKLLVFSQFLATLDVIEEFLTMENPDFISRKHVNTNEVEFF